MTDERIVSHEALAAFVARAYRHIGVPEGDAGLLADTLVQADLWGHQSHGVLRAPWYATRLRTGAMTGQTKVSTVVDASACAVLDGNDGIGQVICQRATEDAIRRARVYGMAAVSVRSSGHFGTAMYFTRQIAAANCIGFISTNASPAMAPWGGVDKIVGNNPWSIAAPIGGGKAMVLDIANTAVARGKIYLAKQEGRAIPGTWAMTADGRVTTDPAEAIAGLILPMGEHKGYGISVMMDVLSGVLAGSQFGTGVHGPYEAQARSGCGHFIMALDIARFRPLDDFVSDMHEMAAQLKASTKADGIDEVFYPGEIEDRADLLNRAQGLRLPAQTLADLDALAAEIGLSDRLPPG